MTTTPPVPPQQSHQRLKDKPGHQIQRVFSNTLTVMGVTRVIFMNLFEMVFLKLPMIAFGGIFVGCISLALILTYILEGGPFDRGFVHGDLETRLTMLREKHKNKTLKLKCYKPHYERVFAEQWHKQRNAKVDYFFNYIIDPITTTGFLFSLVQAVLRYFTNVAITVHLQYFILLGAVMLAALFAVGLRRPEHKVMMDQDVKLKEWLSQKDEHGNYVNLELIDDPEYGPKEPKLSLSKHLMFATIMFVVTAAVYTMFQAFIPGHTLLSAPAPLALTFAGFALICTALAWSGNWPGVWLAVRNIFVATGTTIGVFYFGRMMIMFPTSMDEAAFFMANHHALVSAVFTFAVVFGFLNGLYWFNDRHNQMVFRTLTDNIKQHNPVPADNKTPGVAITPEPSSRVGSPVASPAPASLAPPADPDSLPALTPPPQAV